MKTLIPKILIAVLACTTYGCVVELGEGDQDQQQGDPMSDLFKGVAGGSFGNSVNSLPPAQRQGVAPFGWGEIKTVVKFPGPMRRDNVAQESDSAVITASVYAQPNPDANFVGPLTGIAIWGTGGSAANIAEFDIPVGTSIDPDFALNDPAPFDTPRGGTFISVLGTSLEIRARNDANLLPAGPNKDGSGQLPIGSSGGPAVQAATAPAFVSAAIGKGQRASPFSATKTVYAVNTNQITGVLLVAGASVTVRIPPFAKSFRIARITSGFPGANFAGAISFSVFDNTFGGDGPYTVASGVIAPEVKLGGWQTNITITNTEAANSIFILSVIFYLAL